MIMTRNANKKIVPFIDQLPSFYQNSPEVVDLQNAFTNELDASWLKREDFLNQLNVQTATWSLPLWENLYGVETDTTRSIEFRRACILSKLRGNATATIEMIRNVAKSFCNSDVEVIEYNDEYRFEIKFDGTASTIENKDGFLKAIREMKPAHLNETLIEMTSLPFHVYYGAAIGSYKQEVISYVNI